MLVARRRALREGWRAAGLGAFQIAVCAVCRRGANVFIVCPRRKSFGRYWLKVARGVQGGAFSERAWGRFATLARDAGFVGAGLLWW